VAGAAAQHRRSMKMIPHTAIAEPYFATSLADASSSISFNVATVGIAPALIRRGDSALAGHFI
jgi:hypothetical protein